MLTLMLSAVIGLLLPASSAIATTAQLTVVNAIQDVEARSAGARAAAIPTSFSYHLQGTTSGGAQVAFDFTLGPRESRTLKLNKGTYDLSVQVPVGTALLSIQCSGTAAADVRGSFTRIRFGANTSITCTVTFTVTPPSPCGSGNPPPPGQQYCEPPAGNNPGGGGGGQGGGGGGGQGGGGGTTQRGGPDSGHGTVPGGGGGTGGGGGGGTVGGTLPPGTVRSLIGQGAAGEGTLRLPAGGRRQHATATRPLKFPLLNPFIGSLKGLTDNADSSLDLLLAILAAIAAALAAVAFLRRRRTSSEPPQP